MTLKNKPIWKLAPYARFQRDFLRLNPEGKWIVENMLNAMVCKKNPAAIHRNETCGECAPDWHLFGIPDGLGNKKLGLLVYIDKMNKILHPAAVYKAKPSS